MRLMIDIPDKIYETVQNGTYCGTLYEELKNGTPLSESEDCVSRQALKEKLKENHDFFVNAYGGFKNLPPKDKARVDEITICIAEVVNLPPVTPTEKVGHWIPVSEGLPEKDGDYLVTVKGMRNYIKCCYFALNLYKVDKYDFENKKGVAGFYEYDSEYGYYEMTDVVAWMPLPEPYKMCGGNNNDK